MTSFKINCMLAATIVLWSSAFVGIRIGLVSFTPGSLALLRFLVASICMLFIYPSIPSYGKIRWRDRLQLLLLGTVGIGIYNICLNYGELSVSAGVASFIIGLMPIMTLLLSIVFLKERPTFKMYLGITVSFSGLFCMGLAEKAHASAVGHGILAILLSALTGAVFTVRLKHYLNYYHPIKVAAWTIWGGTLFLMMFTPVLRHEIQSASLNAIIASIYMGIFPAALAYIAWSYILNFMPASKAAIYLYALPVVSTLLGFTLLNEQPSFISFTGGLLALTGAFLASYQRQHLPAVLQEKSDKEISME
ncbi:DMT family transporter [Legionella nagasakiensis]|uniref:DMT family transporter n=1 Tax=Legionella nagasakiensis TaxID=535290 RepID=UPI001054D703|nr:EamA family transporter [Legionella nagasakiensis]